jgi:hypothetical protein
MNSTSSKNLNGQPASKSQSMSEMIRNAISKTQQEVEEFILQLSLGKSDVTDKFEEVKTEFSKKINEWKLAVSKIKNAGKQDINNMKSMLEQLELKLALGKAETKDMFVEQKKRITKALHEFEEATNKHNPEVRESIHEFQNEIEKFKLKLEVLAVEIEMKKVNVSDDFQKAMLHAQIKIDKYFTGLEERIGSAKLKYSDFNNEIKMSYNHLRQALNKL